MVSIIILSRIAVFSALQSELQNLKLQYRATLYTRLQHFGKDSWASVSKTGTGDSLV